MQLGFYFDQTRCTGCGACQVACKDWNDIPAGPEKWMNVKYSEKGTYPNVFVSYLTANCYHCEDPTCQPACPVDAISKTDNGIVLVDSDACIGNVECDSKCLKACPYDAPQFAEGDGAKMRKCDFCAARWDEDKKPICVDACPVRAMDAGEMSDMKAKYGDIQNADQFKYSDRTKPAIVFKPKVFKG